VVFVERLHTSLLDRKQAAAAASATTGTTGTTAPNPTSTCAETPPLVPGPTHVFRETWLRLEEPHDNNSIDIEQLIVQELLKRHDAWIRGGENNVQGA
jgi:hypothetical protein